MRAETIGMISEGWRADGEDEIVAGQQGDDLHAHRRQEAREQQVILRKAALARHRRGEHARIVALGEPYRFVEGVVTIDRRADHEDRLFGGVEKTADLR